jgi:hypothetical protein
VARADGLSEEPRIARLELRRELARVRARWRLVAWVLVVVGLGIAQWQVDAVFAVPLGIAAAALGVAWDRWQAASREDERLEEDLRALTTIYHESPLTIRKWLTREFIDDSIRNLLAAALESEELAHAYWKQAVRPFLQESQQRGLRSGWRYQIDLADLDEDVPLLLDGAPVASMAAGTHRRLHTTVTYTQRIPDPPEMYYVAVVFEGAELPMWFKRPNFLLREVVNVPKALIENLPPRELLTELPATYTPGPATAALGGRLAGVASTLLGAAVVIGEDALRPASLHVDQSGISWGFRLPPALRERLRTATTIRVDLETFMARSQQYFPVVISAPTRHPEVQFNYALAGDIVDVETQVFFSAERPWDARLRTLHETYKRVDVLTESDDWVFVGSGCLFAWWDKPVEDPQ